MTADLPPDEPATHRAPPPMESVHFAPMLGRARVAGALLLPLAAGAAAAAVLLEGPVRVAVCAVLALAAVAVVVRSARLAIVVIDEGIAVRNLRRTVRLVAADVERVDDTSRPLAPLPVHAVTFTGRRGSVAATVTAGASRQELVDLFRVLRRWSAGRNLDNRLEEVEFQDPGARARRFAAGEEVAVPCRLRQTSARGWGPWAEGWLRLPAAVGGPATWRPDDPASVGMVQARAEQPVVLEGAEAVERRPVRYKAEAFHGLDADIVVFRRERSLVELACPVSDVDGVYRHLQAMTAGAAGGGPASAADGPADRPPPAP